MLSHSISKSRTYVAMCTKTNFDGYYFRKFTLPENEENTSDRAAWYFLNRLDFTACIEGCISFEDYQEIKDRANS